MELPGIMQIGQEKYEPLSNIQLAIHFSVAMGITFSEPNEQTEHIHCHHTNGTFIFRFIPTPSVVSQRGDQEDQLWDQMHRKWSDTSQVEVRSLGLLRKQEAENQSVL